MTIDYKLIFIFNMSHLKEYKTNIVNLEYLKNALNRINILYHVAGQDIILPQKDNKNASFQWNGESYTFIYDLDFWTNSLTINSFTEKIKREYSAETVTLNMLQFGFRPESYQTITNSDKYQTVKTKDLILSRYSI